VNKLICGDNVEELGKLEPESFDLVYADPPFFSNRQYEVVWGDEAEVRSFEDRWAGGIEHYIDWMRARVKLVWQVLKPTGSFYLHCDHHANAHLRILLEDIFGRDNFRNEIIWKRQSAHSDARSKFPDIADVLLFFVKSSDAAFTPLYTDHDPDYVAKFYRFDDRDGRGSYRLDNVASPNPRPNMMYEWKGFHWPEKGWRYELGTMRKLDSEGRIYYPRKANGKLDTTKRPALKRYLKEQKGSIVTSIWDDITSLHSADAERQGYPTQKPRKLLRRVLEASSMKGDWVLDPFCGCGTTLLAAQELGRHWVGIDISPTAIKTVEKQLNADNLRRDRDYVLAGMPATLGALRKLKPFEFQNWVVDEMRGWHSRKKSGDMGLDGEIRKDLYHAAAGIQVKQSDDIGRNVVDNFETALKRAGLKKGYIVAFSFGKGAHEEAARVRNSGEIDVILLPVEKLMDKNFSLADAE
jgi:DNA modification methylase